LRGIECLKGLKKKKKERGSMGEEGRQDLHELMLKIY
jgi:hypothetical protein